ncbi:MAG: hypothetical protein G01um101419_547 [Parcubacteria group bacterium Gr01-1014_19]|nr:MAG: hypothetical protein G01um101419_547 [Parcubacteria group bacterium Gr01-1014_19]
MSFDGYAFVGLNERAKKLVAGEQKLAYTEKITRWFPDGSWSKVPDREVFESTVKSEESGFRINESPWLDCPLMMYTMPDGKSYIEQAQQRGVSDSYGFVLLALQDQQGNWLPESLWTPGEISKLMIDLMDDQTKIGQDGEYWVVRATEDPSAWMSAEDWFDRKQNAYRAQVVGNKVVIDGSEKSIDDYEFLGLYREGEISPGVRPESVETEDFSGFE